MKNFNEIKIHFLNNFKELMKNRVFFQNFNFVGLQYQVQAITIQEFSSYFFKFYYYLKKSKKEIKKIHINRTKPSDFLSKIPKKNANKSVFPDMGSYNPMPLNHNTFAKILLENSSKKTKNSSNFSFGKGERFVQKERKSKSFSVPGPGFYNVLYEWKGKKERKDENEKKNDLSAILSKGVDISIYYD